MIQGNERGKFYFQIKHQGLTGLVYFDPNGYRSHLQLDILELTQKVKGLDQVI